MGSRRRRRYSAEFRAEAVKLAMRSDDTFDVLAARLGMNRGTLYSWYRDEMAKSRTKKKRKPAANETPEDELQRLRREVAKLQRKLESAEEDKLILKKAAAFFARESE